MWNGEIMTTDIMIRETKYHEYKDDFLQEDIERLIDEKERLENDNNRLRREKEQLDVQLTLIKNLLKALL
jgi:hypothetical protein